MSKQSDKEAMLAAQVRDKGPTLTRLQQFHANVGEFEGQAVAGYTGPTFRGYILDDDSEKRAAVRVATITAYRLRAKGDAQHLPAVTEAEKRHLLARQAEDAEALAAFRKASARLP
jgi:hypothetical protein